ncbi:hypothetical protein [Amycolatopsis sp. A1MSW2902]|uniref:hypothetical protein n=1 Tax=Amycolatopsis sp. A1MSW2902 TaxID=687413 RepID=UPI00307F916F
MFMTTTGTIRAPSAISQPLSWSIVASAAARATTYAPIPAEASRSSWFSTPAR